MYVYINIATACMPESAHDDDEAGVLWLGRASRVCLGRLRQENIF